MSREDGVPRVCIGRPCGWKLERVDLSAYLTALGYTIAARAPKYGVSFDTFIVQNSRILLNRNKIVEFAHQPQKNDDPEKDGRKRNTHIYFLDPDHRVDAYYNSSDPESTPDAVPFFESAMEFLKEHPGNICAAPYAGSPPMCPIQVFSKNADGELVRLAHEQAKQLRGWHAVEACGTGVMMVDMAVFEKLKQPYFHDVYHDDRDLCLRYSQDVYFCLKAREAGIGVYVNFDCWAGHWQDCMVGKPWEPLVTVEPGCPGEPEAQPQPEQQPTRLVIDGQGDPSWS